MKVEKLIKKDWSRRGLLRTAAGAAGIAAIAAHATREREKAEI